MFACASKLLLCSVWKKGVGSISKCHCALWVMLHLLSEAHCSRSMSCLRFSGRSVIAFCVQICILAYY